MSTISILLQNIPPAAKIWAVEYGFYINDACWMKISSF